MRVEIKVFEGAAEHTYTAILGEPVTTVPVEEMFDQAKQWFYGSLEGGTP